MFFLFNYRIFFIYPVTSGFLGKGCFFMDMFKFTIQMHQSPQLDQIFLIRQLQLLSD